MDPNRGEPKRARRMKRGRRAGTRMRIRHMSTPPDYEQDRVLVANYRNPPWPVPIPPCGLWLDNQGKHAPKVKVTEIRWRAA